MKTLIQIALMLAVVMVSLLARANIQITDCSPGYGPSESNLVAILDDDDLSKVLLVGYLNIGTFFELRVKGCKNMAIVGNDVECEDRAIGAAGPVKVDLDDTPYTGPRRDIKLINGLFDIRGSCRNVAGNPLTIRFK